MPSFDTLSRIYSPLERATFARSLETARTYCLPFVFNCQSGLLIGDGDGRFSSELLRANPKILVDSVDISSAMLARAKTRAGTNSQRLNAIHEDALHYKFPIGHYHFIGLHFCLDCFRQDQIEKLLPQLEASLGPAGLVAYTDFCAEKAWQKILVRLLYHCFHLGAGLEVTSLPKVNWSPNMVISQEASFLRGLVKSQLLTKI